jgi:hypothetical protein
LCAERRSHGAGRNRDGVRPVQRWVSDATGAAKSMAIRELLKISGLDPEWTLPSRFDDNL